LGLEVNKTDVDNSTASKLAEWEAKMKELEEKETKGS
jgi:hypothetical protein